MNEIKIIDNNYNSLGPDHGSVLLEDYGFHIGMADGTTYAIIERDGDLNISLIKLPNGRRSGELQVIPKATNSIHIRAGAG